MKAEEWIQAVHAAIVKAFPTPADHLPDSPIGQLCALLSEVPGELLPPIDAKVETESTNG